MIGAGIIRDLVITRCEAGLKIDFPGGKNRFYVSMDAWSQLPVAVATGKTHAGGTPNFVQTERVPRANGGGIPTRRKE